MLRKGFSLVELMIALAVLAILAAVAIPEFIGMRQRAMYSEGYLLLGEVSKHENTYFAFYDTYGLLRSMGYEASYSPPALPILPGFELFFANYFGVFGFSPADNYRVNFVGLAMPIEGKTIPVLMWETKVIGLFLERGVSSEMQTLNFGTIGTLF